MFPLLSVAAGEAAFDRVIDSVIEPDDDGALKHELLAFGCTEVYDLLLLSQSDIDSLATVKRGVKNMLTCFQDFIVTRHSNGNPVGNDWSTLSVEEFDAFIYNTALLRIRTFDRDTYTFTQQFVPTVTAASLYERRAQVDNTLECTKTVEHVSVDRELEIEPKCDSMAGAVSVEEHFVSEIAVVSDSEELVDISAIKVCSLGKSFGTGGFDVSDDESFCGTFNDSPVTKDVSDYWEFLDDVSFGTVLRGHFVEDVFDCDELYNTHAVLPPGEPPPTFFGILRNWLYVTAKVSVVFCFLTVALGVLFGLSSSVGHRTTSPGTEKSNSQSYSLTFFPGASLIGCRPVELCFMSLWTMLTGSQVLMQVDGQKDVCSVKGDISGVSFGTGNFFGLQTVAPSSDVPTCHFSDGVSVDCASCCTQPGMVHVEFSATESDTIDNTLGAESYLCCEQGATNNNPLHDGCILCSVDYKSWCIFEKTGSDRFYSSLSTQCEHCLFYS